MPANRKVPLRRCVATNEMHPKKEMIRVVRSKEGEVSYENYLRIDNTELDPETVAAMITEKFGL